MSSKEFEREGMVGDKELVESKEKWENRVGDDGKNDYYTDILLNKKPGPITAKIVIFFVFFVIGLIQGYQNVIILDLQERGGSYDDQALFTFSNYPYFLKIFQAPFVDTYYLSIFGKCRTYIVITYLLISLMIFAIAPSSDSFIQPSNIVPLTCFWTFNSFVLVFAVIAGEMWIVKILDDEDKGKGSILLDLGMSVGIFLSYNIFIPLNSVKWLNDNIFTTSPVTKPLVSHSALLIFIASTSLLTGLFILVFIAEKVSPTAENPSFCRVIKTLPKYFTTKTLRNLLLMTTLCAMFGIMFQESMMLKLLDNGYSKTTLVSIDTMTWPVYIIASFVMMKLLIPGQMMKLYFITKISSSILMFMNGINVWYFEKKKNSTVATLVMYVISIIGKFSVPENMFLGYVNYITPHSVGSTFIAFMMSWVNVSNMIPSTIGLKITEERWVPFYSLYFVSISLHLVIILVYGKYIISLDKTDREVFNPDEHKPEMIGAMETPYESQFRGRDISNIRLSDLE